METRADLQRRPPSPGSKALRGQLAAMLTGIATQREDTATVIQEAHEALALLPDEDRISRARVYVALGTAYAYEDRAGRSGPDLAAGQGPGARGRQPLSGHRRHRTAGRHADLPPGPAAGRGSEPAAGAGTGDRPGRQALPFAGTAHALLAEVHLEWNDLEAAAGYLETGLELLRQGGIGYGLIHTFCAKARLARAQGDAQGALQALQTAEQALATASPVAHGPPSRCVPGAAAAVAG